LVFKVGEGFRVDSRTGVLGFALNAFHFRGGWLASHVLYNSTLQIILHDSGTDLGTKQERRGGVAFITQLGKISGFLVEDLQTTLARHHGHQA